MPPRKNLQGIENKGPNVPFKGEAFSAAFDDIPDRTELTFVFDLGGQSAEKTTLLLDDSTNRAGTRNAIPAPTISAPQS